MSAFYEAKRNMGSKPHLVKMFRSGRLQIQARSHQTDITTYLSVTTQHAIA